MGDRHSLLWLAGCVCLVASSASATDKTSLACIQASDEGQTARDSGNLLRSRELFAQCAAQTCPALIRRDCTSWLEQVQQQVPSVVLGAHDSQGRDVLDARVTVDGKSIEKPVDGGSVELNPGSHVIRWEEAGLEPVEVRIALRLQEKNRPVVATFAAPLGATSMSSTASPDALAATGGPERPNAPSSGRVGVPASAYLLGGIGVAALGAFGYFGIRASADSSRLHDTCAPACDHASVESLKTKVLVADIALGVGVVGLATAAFIALRGGRSPRAAAWDVHVAPAEGGARAQMRMTF